MPFYAQIDENNICTSISQLRDDENQPHLIPISSLDNSLLGKTWVSETEEWIDNSNYLYIHITMTDGDGREPIGIVNNNIDAIAITATFRTSEDPTAPIIESITGISWRVTIRNENNNIYDIVDIPFTNGVANISYTTDGKPDVCQLLESDLEKITVGETEYTLKIIGSSTFKVYRSLS